MLRTFAAIMTAGMAALSAAPAPACAQTSYPTRTITMIVPFAAGGPTDIIARILAQSLSQSLGQSVIIDNRAGGGGNLGIAMVARANPDGHTLLLTSTAIAVNPGLFESLPYDPIKDFAPISELVNAPNVLFVKPDSGITSIADLVAKAKAEPNKYNYASPGVGTKSHLTGELLKLRAGINIQHIPYRGGGPATQALVAGTVQVGSVALAPVEPLIKSGTVKALAVTGANRWWSLPDVPTMIEFGLSRLRLRHLQCAVRARRHAAGCVGLAGAGNPRRDGKTRSAGGGASRGLPNCRRHARRDVQALGFRNHGRERARRKSRHQAGVDSGQTRIPLAISQVRRAAVPQPDQTVDKLWTDCDAPVSNQATI